MMASSNKPATASAPRRKSSKPSKIIILKLSPKALQPFSDEPVKEESPVKASPPAQPSTVPAASDVQAEPVPEKKFDTPVASSTPVPSLMPPPVEGVKKKGAKRTAAVALGPDGTPKVRGKPGPKKKARLEDGSIDHSASAPRAAPGTAHKLGPKANQGAINAGLRALDRSGKPCRKWAKGSFKLKSFTGVIWEIPRWTAPPRIKADGTTSESTSGGSSKENKDNSQLESEKSEKSNGVVDIEMGSSINASSPAPPAMPIAPPTPVVVASA